MRNSIGQFGLLGEKLGHSFSPQVHALLGDDKYKLYERNPDEVEDFLKTGEFTGISVTIPYKKTVMPFCAQLSDAAQKIGSVNTLIRRSDGTLYGDNTDYFGFEYLINKLCVDVSGKKAIILGNGGAAATVKAVLGGRGAGDVVVISRSGADNYGNLDRHYDAQIIVNTTPVGMYPNNEDAPIDLSGFKSCRAVIDVIYNPLKTKILIQAESMGIPCIGGLYMLVAQAKRAREIFAGEVAHADTKEKSSWSADPVIERVTCEIMRNMQNIVLIGMPGCGKTTVGQELARLTGREFYDIDEIIVEIAGKSIKSIFEESGEDAFREIETDALKEVSKKSGCVIATGGGIVLREENRKILEQNGVLIYLSRAINELSSAGRPVSLSKGVEVIYNERRHLYESWCGHEIKSLPGVEQTAVAIREVLKL